MASIDNTKVINNGYFFNKLKQQNGLTDDTRGTAGEMRRAVLTISLSWSLVEDEMKRGKRESGLSLLRGT